MKRLVPALLFGVAVGVACGNDQVRRATEEVEVVGGEPTVGQGLPHVSRGDGGMDASFGPAAPFQVDTFDQQEVQKVDILWMVDNSRSMQAKQDRLKANIHNFMQFLADQNVDYHLGVVSSDTFDPAQSGKLQNKAALAEPWISADAGATAEANFVSNLGLGELGSDDEKGLLAGMLALTPPLAATGGANCVGSDCFVRQGAALYTVMLSDEEDSSCSPVQSNHEGCTDSDITFPGNNGYGTTDYWSRFYSGVKGGGGVSKMAAIVATDGTHYDCATEFNYLCAPLISAACAGAPATCIGGANSGSSCCKQLDQNDPTTCAGKLFFRTSQNCHVNPVSPWAPPYLKLTGSWNGCKSVAANGDIEFIAYYSNRYTSVAQATGGVAASICDQDYTPALAQLGLQASGLRSDFPLSRAPISTSIHVLVTPPNSSTPGEVLPGASTWQYVRCSGTTPTNVVRFTDTARPLPGSRIAISYDVNVRGLGTCP